MNNCYGDYGVRNAHNAETYEKPNLTAAERFRYLYTEDELKDWVDADPRASRERIKCTC